MSHLALLLLLLAAGCTVRPGSTIDVLAEAPATVTYEYTRWYASELPAVTARAEAHCQRLGHHAQEVDRRVGRNPLDRTVVTFTCVP